MAEVIEETADACRQLGDCVAMVTWRVVSGGIWVELKAWPPNGAVYKKSQTDASVSLSYLLDLEVHCSQPAAVNTMNLFYSQITFEK